MVERLISLRREGVCSVCSSPVDAGVKAWWTPESRSVTCTSCRSTTPSKAGQSRTATSTGQAGASAQREHDRRAARREDRIRKHIPIPIVADAYLALTNEPQSTRAWARGATGERKAASFLDAVVSDSVRVLHDRRTPGSTANIDHIVVAPSGVFVIDTKRYKGRPHLRNVGGLLRKDVRLYVGSRDCSKLVDGMTKQIMAVDQACADLMTGDPPAFVRPVLCFAEWGILDKAFAIGGVLVDGPRSISRTVRQPGPLTPERVAAIAERLLQRLPAG